LLTLQYYIHEAIAEEFWANLALSNLADFLATATGQKVRSLSYGIGADLSPDWIGSVRIAISNLLTLKPDPSGAVESDWLNCVQPKWIQFREQQTDESFRRHSETVKAVMLRISGQAGGHMWEPLSSDSGLFLQNCCLLLSRSRKLGNVRLLSEAEIQALGDHGKAPDHKEIPTSVLDLVPSVIDYLDQNGWDSKVLTVSQKLEKRKGKVLRGTKGNVGKAMKIARLSQD
jgi:hypothetical protein